MCQAPAAQTGLRRKGRIEVGYDADFCVFAPDETFVVDVDTAAPQERHHAVRRTPARRRRPQHLAARRTPIDIDAEPRGRLLTRGAA